jgi:O-antigen/teichoic acid export membrane protein
MIKRFLLRNSIPLIDQGLSSGTNFIAVLAVARAIGMADFGVFALAYTVLTIVLGIGRAFFGTPIALAAAHSSEALAKLHSNVMSAIAIISIPLVLSVAAIGAFALGTNPSDVAYLAVGIVAVATPIVLAQDISRYYAMAKNQPNTAVASDTVWFVGVVMLFVFGGALDDRTVLVGWVVVIVAALIVFLAKYPFRLDLRGGLSLLAPKAGLKESLAVSVLLSTGLTLVMGFLMLPFLGPAAVGALRGAGTLFGPLNTLIALLDFSILAQMSRRDRSSDKKAVAVITVAMCSISVAWAVVLLLLPQGAGVALLGETWLYTREILPITAIEYVLLSVTASISLVPKLRDRGRLLLLNRVAASVTILVVTVAALLLGGGLEWMALALLAGAVVSAVGMLYSGLAMVRRDPGLATVP